MSGWDGVGVHRCSVPLSVRAMQPHSVHDFLYRPDMPADQPRPYLWQNICTLMGEDDPSLDRVVARTGVGRGSVQRIRSGEQGSQLATIEAIAKKFGIEPWQLLVPGLKRDALPRLATSQQEELRQIIATEVSQAIAKVAPPKPTIPATFADLWALLSEDDRERWYLAGRSLVDPSPPPPSLLADPLPSGANLKKVSARKPQQRHA